ncbi:MAG TPA: recombinase RecT [Bosea sp. (in: a-proteobacteria)]
MAQNLVPALKSDLAKMHGEFAKSLPGHITADRFVRTAQTAIALTRNIEKVTNPASLLAACSKAASDGLILDGREAALVVDYNGDVQYRPMVRGLLKLAYNSGDVKSLVVEAVRDADEFDYSPTRAAEPIIHKIDLKAARGEVYAVYAKAELKDGGIVFEVMTIEDVNRIRDRSDAWKAHKAGKIKSTPWQTDWSEMARKTVFRRLSKYLPSSTDRFQQAVERIDDDYKFEIDHDDTAGEARPAPTTKKRGGAAAALKDVTPKAPAPAAPAQQQDEDDGRFPPHDPETGEIVDAGDPGPQDGDDI